MARPSGSGRSLTSVRWPLIVSIVSLAAIVFAAVLGLLIESWVPDTPWWRAAAVAISLALVIGLYFWRDHLARTGGTLYYVRLLFPSMSDWREQAAADKRRRMQDVRIIQRWIVAEPADGGLDIADGVADIGAVLEAEMNSDSDSTGFHLAPNMLFPAALALGYDMQVRPGFRFDELDSREDEQRSWLFAPTREEIARGGLSRTGFDLPGSIRVGEDAGDGPVLMTVSLTQRPDLSPVNWRIGSHVAVGVFRDGVALPVELGDRPRPKDATRRVHPMDAMLVVRKAIRDAIHDHPGRQVLLNARMSKVTALGVGWLLGNDAEPPGPQGHPGCGHTECRQPGCLRPWSVLVPVLWDQERRGQSYLAVRAHPAQPPVDEILRRLGLGAVGKG